MNTYCINLKNRRNKWIKVQKETAKLNLEPIRFEAVFNTNGHLGCMMSHTGLLENIIHYDGDTVFLVIEDDIKVVGTRKDMDTAIEQLPDDWDMLYLGAHVREPLVRFSDNLFRIKSSMANHAIMYNNQNGVVDYILEHHYIPIDNFYAEKVQERFNCFITYPLICTQAPGYSDTTRWWSDYTFIEEDYKLHTR